MGSIPYDVQNSQRGSCWAGEHDNYADLKYPIESTPPVVDWRTVSLDHAHALKQTNALASHQIMQAITYADEMERELRRSLLQLEEVRDALRRAQRKQNSTEETPHAEH